MKALIDMAESEIREEISRLKEQYTKAQARVDKFGSFKCIDQANKKLREYASTLRIAYQNGYKLSNEEIDIIKLVVGGI